MFYPQFTEEKLGSAEKTELDAHFDNLQQRSDRTKQWTERIVKNTEAVLQPNPSKFEIYYNFFAWLTELSLNTVIVYQFGPGVKHNTSKTVDIKNSGEKKKKT